MSANSAIGVRALLGNSSICVHWRSFADVIGFNSMKQLLLVGFGGALGSMLRFSVSTALHSLVGRAFPWGTLFVNVTGSFVMGVVYVVLVERVALGPEWRSLLMVGLLGGYTTFSSFSIETLNLIEGGDLAKAAVNVLASVVVCLLAVWAGVILGREL